MQRDPRIVEGLRFGLEREGIDVVASSGRDELEAQVAEQPPEVVITGDPSGEEGLGLLAAARSAVSSAGRQVPILYLGNGVSREAALAEGATEIMAQPAYVRDVVTMTKLLAGRREGSSSSLVGELSDHFGVFYLIRAISAIRKRGVLTLVRGLRRGELRFYGGEVTSAQVGMLHGLAAFHQLLLWTEGRFELRSEDVVRRQQIPMSPPELFADSERFLGDVKEVAGRLSPSDILEAVPEASIADLPPEVQEVLRLFEGSRSVADVVEDSPYRMFDTFRVARRLEELGLIRKTPELQSEHRARTALAIEEWLVGNTRGDVEPEGNKPAGSKPSPPADVDLASIIPVRSQAEPEQLSPVVPAAAAAGEILSPRDGPASSEDRDVLDAGPSVQLTALLRERLEEVASGEEEPPPPAPPSPVLPAEDRAESEDAAFTDGERAFFERGRELAAERASSSQESFDDLDEEYDVPKSFWRRFLRDPNQEPRPAKDDKGRPGGRGKPGS